MRRFWTTADLLVRGKTRRDIRRAVEHGQLVVVRKGLLAAPSTPRPLLRTARVGGIASSITAAAVRGLWTPPDLPPGRPRVAPHRPEHDRLHVAFRRTTTRLHDPDDGALPFRPTPAVVLHRTAVRARREGVARRPGGVRARPSQGPRRGDDPLPDAPASRGGTCCSSGRPSRRPSSPPSVVEGVRSGRLRGVPAAQVVPNGCRNVPTVPERSVSLPARCAWRRPRRRAWRSPRPSRRARGALDAVREPLGHRALRPATGPR